MSFAPQYILQKAIYDVLSQDSSLVALISGVYDEIPPDTAMPYLSLKIDHCRDWSTVTTRGYVIGISCQSYSNQGGEMENHAILQRVRGLLDDAALILDSPYHLVTLRFEESFVLPLSAKGYHSQRMSFVARVQEI